MGNIKRDWFTWAHPILIGGQDPKSATSFAAMRVLQPLMGNNREDRQSSTIPIVPGLGDIHHASLHQEQFAWYINKSGCKKAFAYTLIAPIHYMPGDFVQDNNENLTGFALYVGIGAQVNLCDIWTFIRQKYKLSKVDLIDNDKIQDSIKNLLQNGQLQDYYLIYMVSYVKPDLFDLYIPSDYQLQIDTAIWQNFVLQAHQKYPLKKYIAKYTNDIYTNYLDNPDFKIVLDSLSPICLSRFKLRVWMSKIK
jgi:hypothetical protein